MIYLKVNTKSYRTLDYKKNIVNKIKKQKGRDLCKIPQNPLNSHQDI